MSNRTIWMRWILPAIAVVFVACATTTTFESTWKNPDARPLRLTGSKVVAVFVSRDPLLRRRAEDAMAGEITRRGAEGVPAYRFLSDREIKDPDAARERAAARGFTGAVVMRVVGSETRYALAPVAVWIRPPYRRIWGGYWVWGWGSVWEPSYLTVDRIVKVETMVYSLEDDELVWAGVSRTFQPRRIEKLIAELAAAVSDRMVEEGLLTPDVTISGSNRAGHDDDR